MNVDKNDLVSLLNRWQALAAEGTGDPTDLYNDTTDIISRLDDSVQIEELNKKVESQSYIIKEYGKKYHDQKRIIEKHYARIQGQNEEIAELKSSKEAMTSMLNKKTAIIFVLRNRLNKQVCDDINKQNKETFYINIKHMNRRKRYKTLEDASKMTQRNQVVLRVTDCFKVKKEAERVNYD
jgi:hypothetical protein